MKKILFFLIAVLPVLTASCTSPKKEPAPTSTPELINTNIANLAEVVESPAVPVRGFGIVAGLFGTGSSECPVELRTELEKYIWQQIPQAGIISPKRFIESLDTAVVEIIGVIPPMATPGQSFDVVVRPLAGTQTTSLNGGHLYTTDLKEMSRFTKFNQFAKTVARAQGPIFTDPKAAPGGASWYVLGGGYPITSVDISLILNQPDFLAAGTIRNRINERFDPKTANAVSAAEILITIPPAYQSNKERFLALIRQLYLSEQSALKAKRIETLVGQLQAEPDKYIAEISLEAIGRSAMEQVADLLKSDDAATRFHAARCMAYVGDFRCLETLRQFVFDPRSPYRIDALRAIGRNIRLSDAEPIFLRAFGQDDMPLRIAAYEAALEANSINVSRTLVAGSFFVDNVVCGGKKVVYALQKDRTGIVIFGSPIRCSDNVYLQSSDGQVTLNARPGDKFLSVSRNHPARPRVIGPLASGFELTQVIRALAESPDVKQGAMTLPGLALSYNQIIDILEKLCASEALDAAFYQGELTEAGKITQDQ